jgi:alpha-beta hydrolase superfamily lysophospholipase
MKRFNLSKKHKKCLCRSALVAFLILNILSYAGAYTLTHFNSPGHWGLGLPRPTSSKLPTDVGLEYTTQRLPIDRTEWLETWFVPVRDSASKGTILMFPGKGGSKAKQLLPPTKVFHALGYDALLVDFRGVGGSSGNTNTVGVREAKDVALAMNYARNSQLQRPFVLYGVSMGSAAILKAVADKAVNPDGIIIELPFARLLDALRSRLRAISLPTFPLAELLVFWGGIQHGFNGFAHNPVTYASQVRSPTLILHGKLDRWTTMAEINQIFDNLPEPKQLAIFPRTGHSLLVTADKPYWEQSVSQFLKEIE